MSGLSVLYDLTESSEEEIKRLRSEIESLNRTLCDLLAVIHRDGGQYLAVHGVEKACGDADTDVPVGPGKSSAPAQPGCVAKRLADLYGVSSLDLAACQTANAVPKQ